MPVMVADIREGQQDSTGAQVLEVYSRVTSRFAVYRTARRVMIQFSDDDTEGANQRAAIGPIEADRSEVESLIDGTRDDASEYRQRKARGYEDRLARALRIAVQGDLVRSQGMLVAIKNDIAEEQASDVRTWHLVYAAAATLALILFSRILGSDWFGNVFGAFDQRVDGYWDAAAIGAIGAFFSIVLAIRARTVPIDLQTWDNVTDAILRVFVGAASAVLLIALLTGNFVKLSIGTSELNAAPHGIVLAAFVGGFTERLVSNFLNGVGLASRGVERKTDPVAPPVPGANERSVTGEAPRGAANGTAASPATPATPPKIEGEAGDAEAEVEPSEDAVEPDEEEVEAGDGGQGQAVG